MDPFEALDATSRARPPLSLDFPHQQQQVSAKPGWPPVGPATITQYHTQPQYFPSTISGNRVAGGFLQQQTMGRDNSTAVGAPLPAPAGHFMYPAMQDQQEKQQQQQQQQKKDWRNGAASTAAMKHAMYHPSGTAWNTDVLASRHSPPLASTAAATPPQPAPQQVAEGAAVGGSGRRGGQGLAGGAQWTPPAHQRALYDDLWAAASARCAVPGTVSGRAAVQFFSRSGLPKDTLKTIWYLCDPALTGSIRQPGFFAAMRLIAIAQQESSPPAAPSAAMLEATRHALLPPPLMGGFQPTSFTASPPQSGYPAPSASTPAVGREGREHDGPHVGGLSGVTIGHFEAGWDAASGVGACGGGGSLLAPPLSAAGALGEQRSESSPQPSSELIGMSPALPPLSAAAPAQPGPGLSPSPAGGEDDHFGDFEGADKGDAQPTAPPPTVGREDDFGDFEGADVQTQPPAPPTAVDDDDDFGDFESACSTAGGQAFATATKTSMAASPSAFQAAPLTGSVTAATATPGNGGGWDAATSLMMEGDGEGKKGGIDAFIETNLQAATVKATHLADMQATPPPLGRAHDPVMVDRASAARSKLAVFDAMADLDLAVGQEDWNDFADETTAPARAPSPPPPPSSPPPPPSPAVIATLAAAKAGGESEGNSNADVQGSSVPGAPPSEPVPWSAGGGGGATRLWMASSPSSLHKSAEVAASSATVAAALAAAAGGQEERQHDAWGDFEDASGPSSSSEGAGVAAAAAMTVADTTAITPEVRVGSHDDASRDFEGASGPSLLSEGAGVAAAAAMIVADASAITPEVRVGSHDDASRDFEDASGRLVEGVDGERGDADADASNADPGAGQDGDEDWGKFVDAGESAAVGSMGEVDDEKRTEKASATEERETEGSVSADAQAATEEVTDPFAEIAVTSSAGPSAAFFDGATSLYGSGGPAAAPEAAEAEPQPSTLEGVGGSDGSEGAAEITTMGLPLSLHGLRDALARRGQLEAAVEVQKRMERPSPPPPNNPGTSPPLPAKAAATATAHDEDGADGDDSLGDAEAEQVGCGDQEEEGGQEEDPDLARWRAVLDSPRAPALDELAEVMSEADPGGGEIFRARFLEGRPPVEEEALAGGGGAAALFAAVERQRAARRAVFLSSALRGPAAGSDTAAAAAAGSRGAGERHGEGRRTLEGLRNGCGGVEERSDTEAEVALELEIDIGLGMEPRGARPPPTMSDWACMTAYATRMALEGIKVLTGGRGGGGGLGDVAEVTSGPSSSNPPPASPLPSPFSSMSAPEGAASAGPVRAPPIAASDSGIEGGAAGVSGEIARSERFQAFARGLREAVRVCRMTQAAAEDACLKGVDGFASLERAWAEFRRLARGAVNGSANSGANGGARDGCGGVHVDDDDNGEVCSVYGSEGGEDGEEDSVGSVRRACVELAPAGSTLCAVSLQPLAVFAGGGSGNESPPPAGVVEYCGVRYLACAVNLWVNALLDKPPPGLLP